MKYRVMGQDGFNYEEYSCGEYETLKEAEQVKRECEAHAKERCSSSMIEHRYWIEGQGHCKHCDATFFGTAEMIDHGLKKHHDIMRELGYSEEQLL